MQINSLKHVWMGSMAAVCLAGLILIMAAGVQAAPEADDGQGGNGAAEQMAENEHGAQPSGNSDWALFLGVAFTVGIGCVSAGYAVAKVGAAALGAASEKPEIMGRALIFVGLAEGIAIYGLIVGLIMLTRG